MHLSGLYLQYTPAEAQRRCVSSTLLRMMMALIARSLSSRTTMTMRILDLGQVPLYLNFSVSTEWLFRI